MALKTNLVSYWDLSETSGNRNDSHGSNHLLPYNTPGYESDATHGNVLTCLSASTQAVYITDGSQSGLDITGNMTINIWFNPITLDAPSGAHGLVSKWAHATQNQYQFTVNASSNTLTAGADDNCSNYTYAFVSNALGITMAIDTWYMLSFTRTGTTIEVFRNGASLGSGASQTSSNCTADFAIGIERGRDAYKANARFCKAGIWSRALTSTELLELYNGGLGLTYAQLDVPQSTPRSPSGGVAYSGGLTMY